MKHLLLAAALLATPTLARAGVVVYTGMSSEKLFIEDAPKAGKNAAFLKFEGVESPWADKVIKVEKRDTPSGDRYSFEYELELSSGVQKRTYEMVVGAGYELKNGSRVKKIQLFFQGMPNHKPIELDYDEALSKSSQGLGLAKEYEKKPFKPDVD